MTDKPLEIADRTLETVLSGFCVYSIVGDGDIMILFTENEAGNNIPQIFDTEYEAKVEIVEYYSEVIELIEKGDLYDVDLDLNQCMIGFIDVYYDSNYTLYSGDEAHARILLEGNVIEDLN